MERIGTDYKRIYYRMYWFIFVKSQTSPTPWTCAFNPKTDAMPFPLSFNWARKIFVTDFFIIMFPNCLFLLFCSWSVSKSNRQVKQTSEFKTTVLQANHSLCLQCRKIRFVYNSFVPVLLSFQLHFDFICVLMTGTKGSKCHCFSRSQSFNVLLYPPIRK